MNYPRNNSFEPNELYKSLANYLLTLNVGDQLLSTRQISDFYSTSVGSVSYALNYLEEIEAVTLERRGRLGTFLGKKAFGPLWKVIENGPMVIALTIPSFPKGEGLATAVYTLLDKAGIEIYLIFIRGSFNRLQALRNGRCHAAVISALAADELCENSEEIILRLPPKSFVTDHRVFYRKGIEDLSRPLFVGIDPDSFDVKYLTELEFQGSKVEFYPMNFLIADRHFEQSTVDAAVSNLDHIDQLKSNKILSRPLSSRVQEVIGDRDTSAAIIVRPESIPTKIVLGEILDTTAILEIQQKVVDREIAPRY